MGSWGHGEHRSNTVWRTINGKPILSTNGECVRAVDFANLGRNSCHAPEVVEEMAPAVVEDVKPEKIEEMVEIIELAAVVAVLSVENYETSIYFGTDSSALSVKANSILNKFVEVSQGAEQLLAVQVVGHADTRGDADYNLKLSQQPVTAIIEHLAASGIKTTSSFAQSEARPVMENGKENLAASRTAEALIKTQVKTIN